MDERIQIGGQSDQLTIERQRSSRKKCLLTNLRPERGLSRMLCEELAKEMPEFEFVLADDGPVDSIWVCGYEAAQLESVRCLRDEHPDCVLLVTGSGGHWLAEVAELGADFAFEWPLSFDSLGSLLNCGRDQ